MVSSSLIISSNNINTFKYLKNVKSETSYNLKTPQKIDFIKNNEREIESVNFSQCSDTDSMTLICSDYSCKDDHCCDSNVVVYHPYSKDNNFQYCNEHHSLDNGAVLRNKCCEIQKWLDTIINEVRSEIAAEKCECLGTQTCTHGRVSLASFTKEEIVERKKQQNRKAAAKYRLKKKVNLQMDKFEMDLLSRKNRMLKKMAYELESEINSIQNFLINNFNLSLANI
uniref:BZIP domain-containing protein n=1 Tax=Strongyloides papillosus TaxID=174720 RepID=A0A0N5BKQ0_STREA